MNRKTAGQTLARRQLTTLQDRSAQIPDPDRLVHLQFLRFAGCPVCQLHLRAFIRRHSELRAAGVREIVVFHSTRETLLKHEADLPFDAIPDPDKRLYREFGVETSLLAVLNPRVWLSLLRGQAASLSAAIRGRAPLAPLAPKGGALGLPADLLIAPDGRILAVNYGRHASDQWSVDEVLALAAPTAPAGSAVAVG